MRTYPSVTQVARHFADYINRVAYGREQFVLLRGNQAVAELRPVPAGRRLGELPDLLKSLPRLDEEEAAEMAADVERARSELAGHPLHDPWAS
jgi:antitoxin (DNA-binding transcriptional repressor) of toxin-antitoxin stability system